MTLQRHRAAVRGFARLSKMFAWLQGLPNKLTPPSFRLMQIGSAFWQSRVLYVATRLDIAGALGDDTLDVEAIADRVSARPDGVYRLLRMLASIGIFEEVAPRRFCNNRLSHPLREDRPDSVRAMILMHNSSEMSRPWYECLEQGVREDRPPFRLAHGQELYAYMDDHPEFDALFARAMDSVEALSGDSFATDFDWGRFDQVIDLGGSKGSKSLAIMKHHPRIHALVVDRAQVIEQARHHWQGREDPALVSRLHFQAGDILEDIPRAKTEKEIYLLCAVLHGFDDDTCVQVLSNLATASGDSGALIALMEMVVPDWKCDAISASFDMQMLMGTRGRERTLEEWQALFGRSGLRLQEQVDLRSFGKILVLTAATE